MDLKLLLPFQVFTHTSDVAQSHHSRQNGHFLEHL